MGGRNPNPNPNPNRNPSPSPSPSPHPHPNQGLEAHDVGVAASILGYGYIARMLVRCRTGAALPVPCGSCNRQATLRANMAADGFIWYDTGQARS